jgi:hypothetical protein
MHVTNNIKFKIFFLLKIVLHKIKKDRLGYTFRLTKPSSVPYLED